MLEKAELTVHMELKKAAPSVQKSLDNSLEAVAKAFDSTIRTIDSKTETEQIGLLKAYRKFLTEQAEFVEVKLKRLEERTAARK